MTLISEGKKQVALIAACLAGCVLLVAAVCLFLPGRDSVPSDRPHVMVNNTVYYYDADTAPSDRLPEGYSGCGKTTGVGNISDGTLENYYTSFGYIGEEIFSSEQEPAHIYVYTHLFGEGKQRYLRFSSERDEKARIWQEKIADNA